jgi:hypothetical protein
MYSVDKLKSLGMFIPCLCDDFVQKSWRINLVSGWPAPVQYEAKAGVGVYFATLDLYATLDIARI